MCQNRLDAHTTTITSPLATQLPLAANENGRELQPLDHRQWPCQNKKGRIRRRLFDLPSQLPETLPCDFPEPDALTDNAAKSPMLV